ncbi:MAG: dihydrofolate reductase [Gammaproteobacteria bacterium]|nr:MAG: dihydrofolate reductase [Gammaproteobacteria bacterium]
MAENRVIGRENRLPWRLSADLRRFKSLTMGKPVIMGRKTYESIGKPLPGRSNIVVTRDRDYRAQGCRVVHSLEQALEAAAGHDEVMVIGGAQLYRQTLDRAERMYLTLVKTELDGDALFPQIEMRHWRELERESHRADEKNEYDYDFVTLERVLV